MSCSGGSSTSGGSFIWLFIVAVVMVLAGSAGNFIDDYEATNVLQTQGFSDIRIARKDWFLVSLRGCGSGDAAKFSAMAKNPIGNEVSAYVCVGWPFKGATIRSM